MLLVASLLRSLRSRALPAILAGFTALLIIVYYRSILAVESVRADTRPRTEEGLKRFRSEEPLDAKILLLGDSITERWRSDGAKAWADSELHSMGIANAGVGGDRTQHVLWRLDNGLLAGSHPSLIVLLIGTNNLRSDTEKDILLGVQAVVANLQAKFFNVKIILCSVPPWVPDEERELSSAAKVGPVNALLQAYVEGLRSPHLVWWDWSAKFRKPNGLGIEEYFKDHVHLSEKGYALWASLLVPLIKEHLST